MATDAIIAALDYEDPEEHNNHYVYLQGPWFNGLEELRHVCETQNYEDYLALKFSATSVNAVINADDAPPFKVRVTIDGRPLRSDEAGPDVMVSDGGDISPSRNLACMRSLRFLIIPVMN